MAWIVWPARFGSTIAAYPWMSPDVSSWRMRRAQGVGERPDPLGEVRDADAPVTLQDVEDASIRLVELHIWRI